MNYPFELDSTDSSDLDTVSSSSEGFFSTTDENSLEEEETLLTGNLLPFHLEFAWHYSFDCSDVVLKPGQADDQSSSDSISVVEIRCHKFVLAARSKVFQAMFQQSKSQCTFELPDIQDSALVSLLRFMYSDKVNEKDVDMNLLAAAHQLDIPELKIICSSILSSQVSPLAT
jgi:hypothetical protein